MHPRLVPRAPGETGPLNAVWEITMRCDHACLHCGSRAARPRPDELSREELFAVADDLVAIGTREVTLIGGEAYLRPEVFDLIAHLTAGGVFVSMQTGGRGVTERMAERLASAGLRAVGVSIDGPADAHDVLRGVKGSHASAMRALEAARSAGLPTTTNMQVNTLTLGRMWEHWESLRPLGVRGLRAQLTVAMGRAADRPEWLLQPWQVLDALDTLAAIQLEEVRRTREAGRPVGEAMAVNTSNNLGYYGPHEELLRSLPGHQSRYWAGCGAGENVLGIESNGDVKACPSLPSAPYVGGNVRDRPLTELWDHDPLVGLTRGEQGTDELWGFCAGCYYGPVCRAGCNWTAHVTLGRRGNNPYCYHRAATLKARGERERLVHRERAPGEPYDFGRFEVVTEAWPASTGAPTEG